MNVSKWFFRVKNFFSSTIVKSHHSRSAQEWHLRVKGQITKLHSIDIDKSGTHPKHMLYGTIHIEAFQLEGANFEIQESLEFQRKEYDVRKENASVFAVGEIVTLHFSDTDVPVGRFMLK